MTEFNTDINNNLGVVGNGAIPPGLPPAGSYDPNLQTRYSYNLTAVQNLLVDAMLHPITSFTFKNGTIAPLRTFNNTFGCTNLGSNNQCTSPTPQTIELYYGVGDALSEAVLEQMASAVNNVSSTYNMGLTVSVVPLPQGQLTSYYYSGYLQCFSSGWTFDYPWSVDFLVGLFQPGGPDSEFGWNFTRMANLSKQMLQANSNNNVSGLIALTEAMNNYANQEVQYFWTDYPSLVTAGSAVGVFTSNIHGYYFNPSLNGPYFPSMYVTS